MNGTNRPEYLSPEEARRLIAAARNPLDHLFFWILWVTGGRISEILSLMVVDFDFDHQRVTLPALKRKDRNVKLVALWDDALVEELKGLCRGKTAHWRLFPFTRQLAYYKVRVAGRRAGLGEGVHPHTLRHSLAVAWSLNGGNLQLLQRQLGHKRFSTTVDMYQRFSSDDILREAQRINLGTSILNDREEG